MTGLPAQILGLTDRGPIAPDAAADLVLYDPASILDEATYEDPTRRAAGIEWVIVGGQPAIRGGDIVEANLGRVSSSPRRAVHGPGNGGLGPRRGKLTPGDLGRAVADAVREPTNPRPPLSGRPRRRRSGSPLR